MLTKRNIDVFKHNCVSTFVIKLVTIRIIVMINYYFTNTYKMLNEYLKIKVHLIEM